ncbi:MAG TPA: tetratricopeptide repeat protein, partial [Longimicrobiales bacterium]
MTESQRDEIAKLEALYSANPDGRIFTHLAEAYRKAGDLERARETIERGLERHGSYPSAHVVHGRVL